MKVYGVDRNPIELGAVLGRGGEGVVYTRLGREGDACKIYTRPPTAARTAKLTWMVSRLQQHPDLAQWCTWPQELLFDAQQECIGFAMARLEQLRPIHEVYQPEQRKSVLPRAGIFWCAWRRIARGCLRRCTSTT